MEQTQTDTQYKPYIPASKTLPELTLKGIILGLILAGILGASNAYLGLKIGQTITACIPAAVVSMAILRFFRHSNILENNMVQTIASAGEVMAAAAIFTLPALLVVGYWSSFSYWETASITLVGGFLGILFSIPIRRALIIEQKLPFPEGVATAQVLEAGETQGGSVKILLISGFLSAGLQFCQSGFQFMTSAVSRWFYVGDTVAGFGGGLSAAMIGAGYIVGFRVGISLIVGTLAMWCVAIPLYGSLFGVPEAADAAGSVMAIKGTLRYLGVGAMLVGGVAALVSVLKPIKSAVVQAVRALKAGKTDVETIRTERDMPLMSVMIGSILLFIPVGILIHMALSAHDIGLSSHTYVLVMIVALISTFVVGFLVAAICGYMSGLVGSSSNPLSGILIASVLLLATMILMTIGSEVDFKSNLDAALGLTAALILITALIAAIGAVSCDNMQDLKSGHILGSTPWKQQVGLFIGVIVSAFVLTPVMQVLFEAYGMAGVFPRDGMDATKMLAAPQSVLIATVAKGLVFGDLPYKLIFVGGAIGLVSVFINLYMKRTGKGGFPPLGVALGLYLPLEVTVPLFLGTVISHFAVKKRAQMKAADARLADNNGVLFASGAIAGEALIGVFLAVPFAAMQSTDVFRFVPSFLAPHVDLLSVLAVGGLCYYLYKKGSSKSVLK